MRIYDNPPLDVYLEHHGILGQKWGVRRFQNKDGTLTAAGAKRYKTAVQLDIDVAASKNRKVGDPRFLAKEVVTKDSKISDGVRKITETGNTVVDSFNKVLQDVKQKAKDCKRDKEFLKELDDTLYREFGKKCTDPEYFEMVKLSAAQDALYNRTHNGKDNESKAYQKFTKDVEEYFNQVSDVANDITKGFGDMPVSSLKDKSVTYKKVVEEMLHNKSSSGMLSYLMKYDPEYDLEIDDFGLSSYTVEDYNRAHNK